MKYSGLFFKIYTSIVSGDVKLPSLPDVALRIRDAMKDPNHDTEIIAKIIQADPALAGYLISVANSPFYRSMAHADNVKAAITRFGLKVTRNLSTSYTLRNVFRTNNQHLKKIILGIWRRSAHVAAISAIIAKKYSDLDPEQCMLAGMLQDVGTLLLLTQLENNDEVLSDMSGLSQVINEYSSKSGVVLVDHWELGDDITSVVRNRNHWQYDHEGPIDIVDIIILAKLHSFIGTSAMKLCPRINSVPAFKKITSVELTPENSFAIIQQAEVEIKELQSLLGG